MEGSRTLLIQQMHLATVMRCKAYEHDCILVTDGMFSSFNEPAAYQYLRSMAIISRKGSVPTLSLIAVPGLRYSTSWAYARNVREDSFWPDLLQDNNLSTLHWLFRTWKGIEPVLTQQIHLEMLHCTMIFSTVNDHSVQKVYMEGNRIHSHTASILGEGLISRID